MAEIVVHRTEMYQGRFITTYEWIGPIDEPVYLRGEEPADLPWPLHLISIDWMGDQYIRTDISYWRWTEFKIQASKNLQRMNVKLILTAHIWGWVIVYPGEIPSWGSAWRNRWNK